MGMPGADGCTPRGRRVWARLRQRRDYFIKRHRVEPFALFCGELFTRGRTPAAQVEKTDTAYVIRLRNPGAEFSTKDCVDAAEIIKRELGVSDSGKK